jgi:hypothetical protein
VNHGVGATDDYANALFGALVLANTHRPFVITSELLQRVAMMEPNRHRGATAWGWQKRAALAGMLIPKSQQCYPPSVLPAHRFYEPTSESEGD